MSKICDNCEFECDKTFKYCPNCGQNTREDLTVGLIFKNTIHNYFSVDGRLFRSFVPLLLKPGFLPKQFVNGKRLFYLHPAQFYLFASLVFFFLYSFEAQKQEAEVEQAIKRGVIEENSSKKIKDSIHIGSSHFEVKGLNSIDENDSNDITNFKLSNKKVDSLMQSGASDTQILKALGMGEHPSRFEEKFYNQLFKLYKYKSGEPLLKTFYNYVPISLFILLPIFALFLKLAFFRKGNFAYHLVFSLYYFAFIFVIFTLLTLINFAVHLPAITRSFILLSAFVYLYLAVLNFYKSGKISGFIKSVLVFGSFLILIVPVAVIILAIVAFMFY